MSRKPRSKKKKKKSSKKKTSNEIIPIEYHQHIYPLIKKAVDESRYDISSPHHMRDSFFNDIPTDVYSSSTGRNLINQYRLSLESEIERIISKHSIAYWLHIQRRLLPSLTSLGEINTKTSYLVRAILEASMQKNGMTSLCKGIGISTEIAEESILGGLIMQEEFNKIRENIKAHPQLVLTDFGPDQLIEFFNLQN